MAKVIPGHQPPLAVSSPGETETLSRSLQKTTNLLQTNYPEPEFFADRQSGMGDILLRLARARETIKQKSRWELFCQTVDQIVPTTEIAIHLKPLMGRHSLRVQMGAIM